MENLNIYISMATEQAQSTGEDDRAICTKAPELVRKWTLRVTLSNVPIYFILLAT